MDCGMMEKEVVIDGELQANGCSMKFDINECKGCEFYPDEPNNVYELVKLYEKAIDEIKS